MGRRYTVGRSFMAMLKDRGGNFGMMAALAAPLLLAAGGVAIDMADMMTTKTRMQDEADAAALAAASALVSKDPPTLDKAKEIALSFLNAQSTGSAVDGLGTKTAAADPGTADPLSNQAAVDIVESANGATGKAYKVTVLNKQMLQFNAMTRLLGKKSIELETLATAESATETKNALSMFLVLDRSGSMTEKTNVSGVTKIKALKNAVTELLTQLKTADPDRAYVRTAAVSYNSVADTAGKLSWGTESTATYVSKLVATGGTASTQAFKAAYDAISTSSEDDAHKAKNKQVPTKYIVFMTDGDNNNRSDDTATLAKCTEARNKKIEVYTVAFMAPLRGQKLLEDCATNKLTHAFKAENMADLVAAFKAIGDRASAVATRLTK